MDPSDGEKRRFCPDPDGMRVTARPAGGRGGRILWQGVALFLAAGCIGYVLAPSPTVQRPATVPRMPFDRGMDAAVADAPGGPVEASPGQVDAQAPAATASTRPLVPRRRATQRPGQDQPEAGAEPLINFDPGDEPGQIKAGDYIEALHDAGIHTGIGAFKPPGTRPPLQGIAVPEGVELPEGYVRHHQVTDDGHDIEPILMFSPDYDFYDADGNPIEIPEDRVVPPVHLPPGIPDRPIEIPPEQTPGLGED